MSKLILKDARTIEKVLFLLGFVKHRQKGNHAFYKHEDGRCTVIPFFTQAR